MSEHPIIFTGEMVRAILEGRKTQTRRVVKPQPFNDEHVGFSFFSGTEMIELRSIAGSRFVKNPYGKRGDRLWVRETFARTINGAFLFRADYPKGFGSEIIELNTGITSPLVWRPSIHIPRSASRITLEIVNVRVERVQEISVDDCLAEGIKHDADAPLNNYGTGAIERDTYAELWDSINAKRGYGWDVNPWVWVIEFKRINS